MTEYKRLLERLAIALWPKIEIKNDWRPTENECIARAEAAADVANEVAMLKAKQRDAKRSKQRVTNAVAIYLRK